MRSYWYSMFLTLSIVGAMLVDTFSNQMGAVSANPADGLHCPDDGQEGVGFMLEQDGKGEFVAERRTSGQVQVEPSETEKAPAVLASGSMEEEKGADFETKGTANERIGLQTVLNDDFSGTLFIGDSRTVGLSEYGELGQAEVFADSGMSVYNLFSKQVTLRSGGKKTLEEVLSENQFQNIFLMLGINELGYEYPATLIKYGAIVDRIIELQPSAVLVLQANLHVTQNKSAQSAIVTNENINMINEDIKKIADSMGCYYLDVNPLFDDEEGSLAAGYSTDGAHILGKYYSVWVEWVRNGGTMPVPDSDT